MEIPEKAQRKMPDKKPPENGVYPAPGLGQFTLSKSYVYGVASRLYSRLLYVHPDKYF